MLEKTLGKTATILFVVGPLWYMYVDIAFSKPWGVENPTVWGLSWLFGAFVLASWSFVVVTTVLCDD